MTAVAPAANLNSLWASLIVEELVRLGCHFFVLSPGSRSAPLTVAVARYKMIKSVTCFDERSSAFHALGIARATQKPVAVIVTSATAVANLMPAIVEASMSRVPLIILTADRPFELRQVGANQAIDQVKIFGNYVREFIDLPAPDDRVSSRVLLGIIDQIFLKALKPLPGPIHINCMFREPLNPDNVQVYNSDCLTDLQAWQTCEKPFVQHWSHQSNLEKAQVHKIADILNHAERGVIVVGELKAVAALPAILQLSHQLQWPILADVTSGLRFFSDPMVIHAVDHLLLHSRYFEQQLDLVLQFGGRLTSKRLQQFLNRHQGRPYFFVDDYFERVDPDFLVTDQVCTDVVSFCGQVSTFIRPGIRVHAWVQDWQAGSRALNSLFCQSLNESDELSEPYVARAISQSDWSRRALFLSNSMPIRDMNMFAAAGFVPPMIGVNRGASGIDGIISTACGFAVGLGKPVTLLVGDLAFLHDGNGLSFLSKMTIPMIVVVLNNQGGGIFSFLPIVKATDVFSQFFDTSHEHALEGISHAFDVKHTKVKTPRGFDQAYQEALACDQHRVIEVMSNTALNWKHHERLKEKAIAKLQHLC
jgi:2-succinyl-5-enolpyruvyl-6-hydroxy-3-cyclohexene-1-carboxylate synthase